jgi:hypothetical protein
LTRDFGKLSGAEDWYIMARMCGRFLVVLTVAVATVSLSAQDADHHLRVSVPIDWSSRHVIHPGKLNLDLARAGTRDPRIIYDWILHNTQRPSAAQTSSASATGLAGTAIKKPKLQEDWHFPLGNGTVLRSMFPAKFTFDVNATPSCTSDYLAYGLNVAGSASQPNLIRFNNIYAGTSGLCGSNPTVESAYDINTLDNSGVNLLNGIINTSPSLSIDGTKLAFIETVTGATHTCPGFSSNSTCSIFHVITWGTSGNSGSFNTGTNLYSAVTPGGLNDNAVITNLSYSSSTNTWSSPWIDYETDTAFFGDDNGKLYRTTCVFSCATGVSPAIMSGWPVTVAAGVLMSPPVHDSASNKVFVGGSDGKLYAVNVSTATLAGSIVVGAGSTATCTKSGATPPETTCGGVYDGPILDTTFDLLYAFAGNDGSGAGVMMQTNAAFNLNCGGIGGAACIPNSKAVVAMGGPAAGFNIYIGALSAGYYTNAIGGALNASSEIYSCGQQGNSAQPDLYFTNFATVSAGALSLSNPPIMNGASSSVGKVNVAGNSGIGCNPLVEFQNPNATTCGSGTPSSGCDQLFFSQSSTPSLKCVSGGIANEGCTYMYPINSPPGTNTNGIALFAQEFNGTGAQVVDNVSTQPQASSIYFANERATPLTGTTETPLCTLGTGAGATDAFCAIKLTQAGLQ